MRKPHRHRIAMALLLSVFLVGASQSAVAEQLLVGLEIQASHLNLRYPSEVRETRLSRLELRWHEHLNSWLDGEIRLGTLLLSQSSNPLPAGQSTRGNDLGLGLSFRLYSTHSLTVHIDTNYRYTDSQAQLASQEVQQRWHQLDVSTQGDMAIGRFSYLSLAVGTIVVDGEEVTTGTVNSVSSFRSDTPGYARLGLVLGLDRDSHVGIEVSTGSVSGGFLTFQRWF